MFQPVASGCGPQHCLEGTFLWDQSTCLARQTSDIEVINLQRSRDPIEKRYTEYTTIGKDRSILENSHDTLPLVYKGRGYIEDQFYGVKSLVDDKKHVYLE